MQFDFSQITVKIVNTSEKEFDFNFNEIEFLK